MKFSLDAAQVNKLKEWMKTLPPEPPTAIGGAFTYSFTPTSLGDVIKVKYFTGDEIDLSDYEDW